MSDFVRKHDDGLHRCKWAGVDELYVNYHDTEWGVPLRGDDAMFERVALEGFQAGLSWITILRRRENFRKAFKNFEIAKVARMSDNDVEKLMGNEGIIRNRAKIASTISNAKLTLKLEGSLSEIIWDHAPKVRTKRVSAEKFEFVAITPESEALSKTLRKLGFSFVGPTTMYALMQSIGMVNDHAPGCFRRNQLQD